jgi:hypothetical protein
MWSGLCRPPRFLIQINFFKSHHPTAEPFIVLTPHVSDVPCLQLVKSLLCWWRFDEPRGLGHNENESTSDEVPRRPLSPSPQHHVLVAIKLCLEYLDGIRGRTQIQGYIRPSTYRRVKVLYLCGKLPNVIPPAGSHP